MDITITIPNAKLAEFKEGFLKRYPVPKGEDGLPMMTEQQWLKAWIIGELKKAYREGKRKIAVEAATVVYDDDGIS